MSADLAQDLARLVGDPARVLTNPQIVERLSRDFYWYSPVLRQLLDGKTADVVVQPTSTGELKAVLRYCFAHSVPVTARGSGTGNYGQAVPLEGGVVLDLSLLDKIEAIDEDGIAVCQPGVRLGSLEAEAGRAGWELRCYPSTVVKASVGGFLAGGSGGIGSVTHGGLRDFGTVRSIEVLTMEAEPRLIRHDGDAIHEILHAWGTNGIITRIWLALTPKIEWSQCAVAFESFSAAFRFSEEIAANDRWKKRLITVFEWPIPSFFTPVKTLARPGKALVFFMIWTGQCGEFLEAAKFEGGEITYSGDFRGFRTIPLLSDYTWNHTTLWAIRYDDSYTYLQCGFDPEHCRQQFAQLKERYGDDFLLHIEFMKRGDGVMIPGAIPVVRFTSEERLNDMIDHCRKLGVNVANPHVNNVEGGGRYRPDNIQLLAKQRYDSRGLLNPGKMSTFTTALPVAEK